ncbi:response regulator transcription factor [Chloroflexota bacterium]
MEESEATKQPGLVIERVARQRAIDKANVAKWSLNVALILFGILITIIILISQGIGINVVAPLAILGLATVWLMGSKRWNYLYQRFYTEELSDMRQKPSEEAVAFIAQFTPQEIKILNYIAQGHLNKQIATELDLSESTVKTHITTILSKMNASDRTEAVVTAIKHGLIFVT